MRRLDRPLLVVWLALVWMLLWGPVSWLVPVSAMLVAPVCLAASRLPAHTRLTTPRLRRLPVLLGRFVGDLVTSSARLTWTTVRRGPRVRSAIVALEVSHCSEAVLATVANRLSLEPGSLVLGVDREHDRLYAYVLDVRTRDDVETARAQAQRSIDDVLRTFRAPTTNPFRPDEETGAGP